MSEALPTMVLLAEDEFLIHDLIESTLQEAGYFVKAVDNGADGMILVEAEALTATGLVTDVNLGRRLSGWDIARRSRELNPALLVVYVTGDSEHEYSAYGLPHSLLIQKPFVGSEIVVALATLRAKATSA